MYGIAPVELYSLRIIFAEEFFFSEICFINSLCIKQSIRTTWQRVLCSVRWRQCTPCIGTREIKRNEAMGLEM